MIDYGMYEILKYGKDELRLYYDKEYVLKEKLTNKVFTFDNIDQLVQHIEKDLNEVDDEFGNS